MAKAQLQTVIALPVTDVYAALSDLERRPGLDPTISEVIAAELPARLGASFSGRGSFTGSDSGFEGTVTAAEPDQLLGDHELFGGCAGWVDLLVGRLDHREADAKLLEDRTPLRGA